jgi:hypothetical protein
MAMKFQKAFCSLILLLSLAVCPAAQEEKKISDNSFLIEEAYNQDKDTMQSITNFSRNVRRNEWELNFTQEFAVTNRRHQLSYTLRGKREDGEQGFGDTLINYRYQLAGMNDDDKVFVAPRLTLVLPTGNWRRGLGNGAVGYQFNLPISIEHSEKFVTHYNAGATVTPRAKNEFRERATTKDFNLGQSFVWLAKPRFNVLFETFYETTEKVIAPSRTEREHEVFLNPGIRWAWNFKNGLQIVPGVAVPIGVGPSYGDTKIFFYLSFEHPYRKSN